MRIEFIKNYFLRNYRLLLISLFIFIIFFIVGIFNGYSSVGGNTGQISQNAYSIGNISLSTGGLTSWDLFINNFLVGLRIFLGGFLFSLYSIFLVITNALTIGAPFGVDFTFASVTIIPHSIFEYPALIFALTGAFLITKIEIGIIRSFMSVDKSVSESINESKVMMKDIILSFIIMLILLIVAALIEGNLTAPFAMWFYNA